MLDKRKYSPSLNQLIYFQIQKILALKIIEMHEAHWKEKGWDKADYYFKCDIKFFERLVSNLFFRFLNNKVEKV